jgi:hypothetical protein
MALPVSQTAERLAVAQIERHSMVPLLDINRVASLANLAQFDHQQVRVALHDGLLVPCLIEDNFIVCSILYT